MRSGDSHESLRCGWAFALLIPVIANSSIFAADAPAAPATLPVTVSHRNGWCVAETRNFACWTCQGTQPARELAKTCETWRAQLCEVWGVESADAAWTPRCEIVIHPSQIAYCRALRRPGDASVGSTRMQFDGDRVVQRRIDLRCDASDWTTAALPHELTHVVLAERFGGRPLPPWADEGLAMLSESAAKRAVRLADLRHALRHRPTYRLRELLSVRQLPPAHLRDAFYGQSLALTSCLIDRSTPQDFAEFLEACQSSSIDAALQQEFGLAGTESLEAEWRAWMRSPEAITIVDLWAGFDAKMSVAMTDDE